MSDRKSHMLDIDLSFTSITSFKPHYNSVRELYYLPHFPIGKLRH